MNKGCDIGLELIDAAMDAALDLLVGEESKPAFYLIEPGGAGRGEVEVIARVAGEPRFDGWVSKSSVKWAKRVCRGAGFRCIS